MSVRVFTCRERLQPVRATNLWRAVRFTVDGLELERRLVPRVEDPGEELNAGSPVGRALLTMSAGDEREVETPGGRVVVKVLEIRQDTGSRP